MHDNTVEVLTRLARANAPRDRSLPRGADRRGRRARRAAVALLAGAAAASCVPGVIGDSAGDARVSGACGNGACDHGETCASCSRDCGACAPERDAGARDATLAAGDASPSPDAASTADAGPSPVRAFPTAEGFGANAVGGRGGRVLHVTQLGDSGRGSLREAVEATGPRIIVFDVSGTIETTGLRVTAANSFVTIAGQTSPGGIQLKGQGLIVSAGGHDVVMRHLRVRPGARAHASVSDGQTNALTAYGATEDDTGHERIYNLIFDHVSMEWADDDTAQMWRWVEDTTYQWCLLAEAVDPPIDGADQHEGRKGFLIGSAARNLTGTVHHSVLAHIAIRNPNMSSAGLVDWRNNLVYDFGYTSVNLGSWFVNETDRGAGGGSAQANFVGNLYVPGEAYNGFDPTYPRSWPFAVMNGCRERGSDGACTGLGGVPVTRAGTRIYTEDNRSQACPRGCTRDINGDGVVDDWDNGFADWDAYYANGGVEVLDVHPADRRVFRSETPFPTPPVVTHPADALEPILLGANGVGATRPRRDEVDARIVGEVASRTGRQPAPYTSPDHYTGGPWPDLAGGAPPAPRDGDGDGMPDEWEARHGLDPSNASDGSRVAANGYTNVENYLNELAGDPVP